MHILLLLISFIIVNNNCKASQLTQKIAAKYCNLTADYVIVGVGTAGALMANQLTSDLQTSVIALHSGDNLTENPLIKFSRNAALTVPASFLDTPLYQNGFTVPQVNADNRLLFWAIALPEGGASSINAGAWSRQTTYINEQWQNITGSSDWSPAVLLNVYKQLEDYHGTTSNSAFRGFNGPINIIQFPVPTAVSTQFTNAIAAATGKPIIVDYNDPLTPIGACPQLQYTQMGPNGVLRGSSATFFLNESVMTPEGQGLNGRKLQVLFEATGLRTIWSGTTAIGVEFLKNGVMQKAMARKGVIVCAGLKSSPFLMYSGIGPSSLLESLNIPVIFDNPNVGQGMVDHPSVHVGFSSNPNDTQVPPADPNGLFAQIAYLPDPTGDQTLRAFRLATVNPIPGFVMGVLDLVQPKSRGSITITSPDPLQPPQVNPGYLSNSDDLALYQRAMQITIAAINAAFTDPDYKLIFPNPAILADPVAVIDYIKENLNPNLSYQSHCRMAPVDQGGVVDSTGHVYGVHNLIIADDSIIPLCMDGAPMASAYLMAANVARMLMR